MIPALTAADILGTGIDQAIRFGAPPDMVARLRGALAFATIGRGGQPVIKYPPCVQSIPPEGNDVVRDE